MCLASYSYLNFFHVNIATIIFIMFKLMIEECHKRMSTALTGQLSWNEAIPVKNLSTLSFV